MLLRTNDIHHLVLSGIATSGVVLSTLREAADKDCTLTVLSDLSADLDDEVHRLLLEKRLSEASNGHHGGGVDRVGVIFLERSA